jgi:hypothetical protein
VCPTLTQYNVLAFLQHSISSFTISEGSVSSLTAVSSQCSQEFV